jgi:hypothetical protein
VEWQITFSDEPELMVIRAWGAATPEGFKAYFAEAVGHPRWRPWVDCLLDFRDLDLAVLPTEQLKALAAFFSENNEGVAASHVAIVVTRSVEFGVARMWTTLSEDVGMNQRVFYDLEEARAWLAAQEPHRGPPGG